MLTPIRDFIHVSVAKKTEDRSPGGILLPGIIDEKIVVGKVLSVGSGYLTDSGTIVPLEVRVGDNILFNKQMAVEVKHGGETVFILREEHILSIDK